MSEIYYKIFFGEIIMKRKLSVILFFGILIIFICIIFNAIRINDVKKYTINPNCIQINKVDFDDNKLSFSGYVIGNSFYGDYIGYEYVVKRNELYIMLYSNDVRTKLEDNIEIEIIDDKLYDVEKAYLKQGSVTRSIATK